MCIQYFHSAEQRIYKVTGADDGGHREEVVFVKVGAEKNEDLRIQHPLPSPTTTTSMNSSRRKLVNVAKSY